MTWSKYVEFLAFAVVLILIPGPGFAVVTKNTLAGLGAVIVKVQPLSDPGPRRSYGTRQPRSLQMILIWLVAGGHNDVCC